MIINLKAIKARKSFCKMRIFCKESLLAHLYPTTKNRSKHGSNPPNIIKKKKGEN